MVCRVGKIRRISTFSSVFHSVNLPNYPLRNDYFWIRQIWNFQQRQIVDFFCMATFLLICIVRVFVCFFSLIFKFIKKYISIEKQHLSRFKKLIGACLPQFSMWPFKSMYCYFLRVLRRSEIYFSSVKPNNGLYFIIFLYFPQDPNSLREEAKAKMAPHRSEL